MNGQAIVLPNRQQQEQVAIQLRLNIAAAVLPELAALDYARAYSVAIDKEDPLGTHTAEDGPLRINIGVNADMVCQAACIYAETLLAMHGITVPKEQKPAESSEWEKANNQ